MKNLWNYSEAKKFIKKYKSLNCSSDLALRVYTSRLLGANKELVLHGGGNTSVKTKQKDIDGVEYDVICVKGSGWDLDSIEPEGLPAVKLQPLLKLKNKKKLTDNDMVSYQKRQLLDLKSPNPSVETFLHAFLPFKYVDHTHSNAVLSLTNRKDGYKICKKIFSDNVSIIKYVMPGFDLAREVNLAYQKNPNINCLILMNHGIFTFANDPKESYDLMIKYVTQAERYEKSLSPRKVKKIKSKKNVINIEKILPIIRGYYKTNSINKYILSYRTNSIIKEFMNYSVAEKSLNEGTVTPDHVIRIKPFPMFIASKYLIDQDIFIKRIKKEFELYKKKYISYFKKNNDSKNKKVMLDPYPCIIYLQGLGMISIGSNIKSSKIAGDVAEQNINVIKKIERTTNFKTISKKNLFNVEYWSLEQAKINNKKKELEGNIVVITGGTGRIGSATAKLFKKHGAEVIALDISTKKIKDFNKLNIGLAIKCDVRNKHDIKRAYDYIIREYGGIDILISNAGTAPQGRIGDVGDHILRESFEDNFFSHQNCAAQAVNIMIQQRLKGCLLFNISKQSVNPGKNFGPYGLPKTALLNLCKQYALDYGEYGIRSNGINADRIISGILNQEMIKKRAKARNISVKDYMSGNLLHEEVKADDVAKGFLHLALSQKTTGAIITIDGGNIAASLR